MTYDSKNPHPDLGDFGGRYNYFVGSEWAREKTANPKALRAAILELLKRAQAEGAIPSKKGGVTYGVRVRWSGYKLSACVTIKGWTRGILSPEYVERMEIHRHSFGRSRYTENARAIHETIIGLLSRINYDRSDIHTDYFDCGFLADVIFDADAERADYDRLAAAIER